VNSHASSRTDDEFRRRTLPLNVWEMLNGVGAIVQIFWLIRPAHSSLFVEVRRERHRCRKAPPTKMMDGIVPVVSFTA
jgi:hypothetical protein